MEMLYDLIESSQFSKLKKEDFIELFGSKILHKLDDLVEQGELVYEHPYYYKIDNIRYIKGTLRVNIKGFGFVDTEHGSYYVPKNKMHTAMDKDLIIGKKVQYLDSDELEILRVLNRKVTQFVGIVKGNRIIADNLKLKQSLKIMNLQQFKLVNGHKVLCEIVNYGKTLEVKILKIIGHKDEIGVDIESIVYDHNIDPFFSEDVLASLESIDETINFENRKDLTNLLTITIDGEDAKDLDDAISIVQEDKNTRLYVHIADVSHYVQENTLLDEVARERGTSVYLIDRVIPMLPQYLSNGICSLHQGVNRYTITCEMLFNRQGEIESYEIYPSVICSDYRTSYDDINKLMNGDEKLWEKYEEIYPMCQQALILSDKITNLRKKEGAVDFDTKEAKFKLNSQGKIKNISIRKQHKIHRLIENFMVSANTCVAEFMFYQQLPALYRVHAKPDVKKMREFIQFLQILNIKHKINLQHIHSLQLQQLLNQVKSLPVYPMISKILLRNMQKAYYDTECLGHFGLALNHYAHFTSPIRRYPDLIVHRSLRKFLFEKQFNNLLSFEKKCVEIAKHSSDMEKNAIECERAVEDFKKCEFMKNKIGSHYKGIISGIQNFGIFVELENTVEGLIRIKDLNEAAYFNEKAKVIVTKSKTYKIGDVIAIEVSDVDIWNRTIDFKLRRKTNEKTRRTKSKSKT